MTPFASTYPHWIDFSGVQAIAPAKIARFSGNFCDFLPIRTFAIASICDKWCTRIILWRDVGADRSDTRVSVALSQGINGLDLGAATLFSRRCRRLFNGL